MKRDIIKYLSILLFIIFGCVLIAHSLTSSETVADYAARENKTQMSVQPEIEQIPHVKVLSLHHMWNRYHI